MFTWRTNAKKDGTPQGFFENMRRKKIPVVFFTNGENKSGGFSFVGIVNESVHVPPGEAGLQFMRDFIRKHPKIKRVGEPPFTGGFVGFVSYDLGEKWQAIKRKSSKPQVVPKIFFVYVDTVVVFNNPIKINAKNKMHSQKSTSHKGLPISNLSPEQYAKKIRRIKEFLLDGETYQVNFSQQFTAPFSDDSFELYKKLNQINPSPFEFFLETQNFAVVSNSPERLFKIHEGMIETTPIKGTVARGKTASEDKKNIAQLLKSEKQAAELAMIVDLERNDLGKICEPRSVEVKEHRRVEKYSHVIHTSSTIRGKLNKKTDWLDALRALFPGGSVTGCPKKRTMEIIHALEDRSRGVYCGSAGYINLNGDCDFNILIRTLWVDKKKKKVIFNSGGGVVADSNASSEYEESLNKAEAIFDALGTNGHRSK